MERLYDTIKDRGLSNNNEKIAERSFEKKLKMFKGNPIKAMAKQNGSNILSPKDFLPELHEKTHFKAAYSIMLNH